MSSELHLAQAESNQVLDTSQTLSKETAYVYYFGVSKQWFLMHSHYLLNASD